MRHKKLRKILSDNSDKSTGEKGAALVTALLILLLLMGFLALAVSRINTETIVTDNDLSEAKTFAAAEAALENTTRDFVDVFEFKLSPNSADVSNVLKKSVPGFDKYSFTKNIQKTKSGEVIVLTAGNYGGLHALRDSWEIEVLAEENSSEVKSQIKRRFFSDRIPIFQFGVFYEDDLELNRPPLFTLGGRVHTNGNFFVSAFNGAGIYLDSKVTVVGEIVNDIWKTKTGLTGNVDNMGQVFVKDAAGIPRELKTGEASVICVNPPGANVFALKPKLPYCGKNPNWTTQKAKFQGNLESNVTPINLPLTKMNVDLIELVKRGKNVGDLHKLGGSTVAVSSSTQDTDTVSRERFANKQGMRISLADAQNKLPGCAGVATGTACGVRLDGALGTSIGYQPLTMTDGYKATALNATRMAISGREVWIKVETVSFSINDAAPQTKDITQDILSLGVTEPAPVGGNLQLWDYSTTTDSRSIIKLQRFAVDGAGIPDTGSDSYMTAVNIDGKAQNFVVKYQNVTTNPVGGCTGCSVLDIFARPSPEAKAGSNATSAKEDAVHLKWANFYNYGYRYAIVPFPIKMFDSREGLSEDSYTAAQTYFGSGNVPQAGVMSLVDIDVDNLRKFLKGDFNGKFPTNTPFATAKGTGLASSDVPDNAGWVVYFSDRRGDYDFDGEYDMEDVFPNGVLDYNEDVNGNNILDVDFANEAPRYTDAVARGRAATADHSYYRRGVRLINGTTIPGIYDATTADNTKGFTFASENGIYVRGNYNATSATVSSGTAVTPPENYYPQNSANHIPAAVVGDAVVILSNAWSDANSFINPFYGRNRVASNTQVRFAMISGDPITGNTSITYAPSQFGQLNGGVHNFKRFLESWNDKRLNYSGSLINLYNSRNNNGFQKCCTTVYDPPIRDWTFDKTFLSVERLPPGTPYIYSISFTGFQRVNE